MPGSTSPMRSTCSAASAATSRRRAAMSAPPRPTPMRSASRSSPKPRAPMPMPPAPRERLAVATRIVELLDRVAADSPSAGSKSACNHAARYGAHRRAAQPATGRDSGHRRRARQRTVPAGDADRPRARRAAPNGGRARPFPCGSTSRSRSATAPRCWPAVPTSARPNGGSLPRPPASASQRPIFIRRITLGGSVGSRSRQHRQSVQQPDRLAARPADQLVLHRPCPGTRAGRRRRGRRRRRRSPNSTARCFARSRKPRPRCRSTPIRSSRREALKAARDQAEVAARIIRAQQREGQVDSLALLDAERTFAEAEADLATMNGRVSTAQIDLFRALGGGWGA